MKASIMEIERFAIHDGPGIRSIVFLQGCPLRCPWCANPESQEIKPQLMYNEDKCINSQRFRECLGLIGILFGYYNEQR